MVLPIPYIECHQVMTIIILITVEMHRITYLAMQLHT